MRSDKKEKIKALYRLERLVYKKRKTKEEKEEIDKLRAIVDPEAPVVKNETKFDKQKYLKLAAAGFKDSEIAEMLGMQRNSLYVAKVREGLLDEKREKRKPKGKVDFRQLKVGEYSYTYDKRMIAAGYNGTEIANKMGISDATYCRWHKKAFDKEYRELLEWKAKRQAFNPKLDEEMKRLGYSRDVRCELYGINYTKYYSLTKKYNQGA